MVTPALGCGGVSRDYCRYLQVIRNVTTQKSLCDNSRDESCTAHWVVFLGKGGRCAFQVHFQNAVINSEGSPTRSFPKGRVIKHWHRLPKRLWTLLLEDVQKLSRCGHGQPPPGVPVWAGGWTRCPPEIPSNPSPSMKIRAVPPFPGTNGRKSLFSSVYPIAGWHQKRLQKCWCFFFFFFLQPPGFFLSVVVHGWLTSTWSQIIKPLSYRTQCSSWVRSSKIKASVLSVLLLPFYRFKGVKGPAKQILASSRRTDVNFFQTRLWNDYLCSKHVIKGSTNLRSGYWGTDEHYPKRKCIPGRAACRTWRVFRWQHPSSQVQCSCAELFSVYLQTLHYLMPAWKITSCDLTRQQTCVLWAWMFFHLFLRGQYVHAKTLLSNRSRKQRLH